MTKVNDNTVTNTTVEDNKEMVNMTKVNSEAVVEEIVEVDTSYSMEDLVGICEQYGFKGYEKYKKEELVNLVNRAFKIMKERKEKEIEKKLRQQPLGAEFWKDVENRSKARDNKEMANMTNNESSNVKTRYVEVGGQKIKCFEGTVEELTNKKEELIEEDKKEVVVESNNAKLEVVLRKVRHLTNENRLSVTSEQGIIKVLGLEEVAELYKNMRPQEDVYNTDAEAFLNKSNKQMIVSEIDELLNDCQYMSKDEAGKMNFELGRIVRRNVDPIQLAQSKSESKVDKKQIIKEHEAKVAEQAHTQVTEALKEEVKVTEVRPTKVNIKPEVVETEATKEAIAKAGVTQVTEESSRETKRSAAKSTKLPTNLIKGRDKHDKEKMRGGKHRFGIKVNTRAIRQLLLGKGRIFNQIMVVLNDDAYEIKIGSKQVSSYSQTIGTESVVLNGSQEDVAKGLVTLVYQNTNNESPATGLERIKDQENFCYLNITKGLFAIKQELNGQVLFLDFATGKVLGTEKDFYGDNDKVYCLSTFNTSPSQERQHKTDLIDMSMVDVDEVKANETFGSYAFICAQEFMEMKDLMKANARLSQPFTGFTEVGAVKNYAIYIGATGTIGNNQGKDSVHPDSNDGGSQICSDSLSQYMANSRGVIVDPKCFLGMTIQARPYMFKTQFDVIERNFMVEAIKNVPTEVYSREELARNTELKDEIQYAIGFTKKYLAKENRLTDLENKYVVIVDTDADKANYLDKVEVISDLNAVKATHDLLKVSPLRIMQIPKDSKVRFSRQALEKMFYANPIKAMELFQRYANMTMVDKFGGLDQLFKGGEYKSRMMDMNTIEEGKFNFLESVRTTGGEVTTILNKLFESTMANVTTAMSSVLEKMSANIDGVYCQLLSDICATFFGVKLLEMNEAFNPIASKKKYSRGIGIKYPSMDLGEYAKLKMVSFTEMMRRIDESALTEAQKEIMRTYYKNVKDSTIIISSYEDIKSMLAGADFDYDALQVILEEEVVDVYWAGKESVVEIVYDNNNKDKDKGEKRQSWATKQYINKIKKRKLSIQRDTGRALYQSLTQKGRSVGQVTNDAALFKALTMIAKTAYAKQDQETIQSVCDMLNSASYGRKKYKGVKWGNVVEELKSRMPVTKRVANDCQFGDAYEYNVVTIAVSQVPAIESLLIDTAWTPQNLLMKLRAANVLGRFYQESTIDSAKDKSKFYDGVCYIRNGKDWVNSDIKLHLNRTDFKVTMTESYGLVGKKDEKFDITDLNKVVANNKIIKITDALGMDKYIVLSPLSVARITFANDISEFMYEVSDLRTSIVTDDMIDSDFAQAVRSMKVDLLGDLAVGDVDLGEFGKQFNNSDVSYVNENVFSTTSIINRASKEYITLTNVKSSAKDEDVTTYYSQKAKELTRGLSNQIRNIAKIEGISSIELGRLMLRVGNLQNSTFAFNVCSEEVYMYLVSKGFIKCPFYGSVLEIGKKHVNEGQVLDFNAGVARTADNKYIRLAEEFTGTATINKFNGRFYATKDIMVGLQNIIDEELTMTESNEIVFTVNADEQVSNTYVPGCELNLEDKYNRTTLAQNFKLAQDAGLVMCSGFDKVAYGVANINAISEIDGQAARLFTIQTSPSMAAYLTGAFIRIKTVVAPTIEEDKADRYTSFMVIAEIEDTENDLDFINVTPSPQSSLANVRELLYSGVNFESKPMTTETVNTNATTATEYPQTIENEADAIFEEEFDYQNYLDSFCGSMFGESETEDSNTPVIEDIRDLSCEIFNNPDFDPNTYPELYKEFLDNQAKKKAQREAKNDFVGNMFATEETVEETQEAPEVESTEETVDFVGNMFATETVAETEVPATEEELVEEVDFCGNMFNC